MKKATIEINGREARLLREALIGLGAKHLEYAHGATDKAFAKMSRETAEETKQLIAKIAEAMRD